MGKIKRARTVIYDNLLSLGLKENKDLLKYLITYNKHFDGVRVLDREPYTIISHAFEKESNIKDISLWYKTTGTTDEQWLALTEEERFIRLKKATNVKKDAVAESRITGTSFKPHYIGGYSQELNHSMFEKGYTWEIASKKYEIDLTKTIDQIKEVSDFAKETHSFHAHVVFDMAKDYEHFDKFQLWSKYANDYMYLKGMEEALHGNYLTGVAHLPGSAPPKVKMMVGNTLPGKLSDVSMQSHKFFSMGVRASIYGNSPVKGFQKLGLELRDTTRKLDVLDSHMKKVSDTVSEHSWEKIPEEVSMSNLPRIRLNKEFIELELGGIVSNEFLRQLQKNVITAGIPLNRYENLKYIDFKTGEYIELTLEQKERVVKAREYYIKEMKSIDVNLKELKASGEGYETEDVEMAVQMTMTEWAKMARVSDFFERI